MVDSYDAIIVGSGQGGSPLAVNLAEEGWETALVEKAELGGTCVNVGCTPTKTMVASARTAHVAETGGHLGVDCDVSINFGRIMERKNQIVSSFRSGKEASMDLGNLDVIRGQAEFTNDRTLNVAGRTLQSERIVLNVGLRPAIPPISGLEDVDYLTSSDLLDIDYVPDHLLVIGGGDVGCEFAQMFSRFGSKVTIFQGGDRLLDREDKDITDEVEVVFEEEGITIETGARVNSVTEKNGRLEVEADGIKHKGDEVLVAAGRRPNTDKLSLENTALDLDENGFLPVDDHLRTGVEGIWAIGDVTGNAPFTNVSYHDHQILYEDWNEGGSDRTRPGERNVTYAVFIDPPVAGVGLNERDAQERGIDYEVAKTPMSHVARGIEAGETEGLLKVLADPETSQILGASVMGMRADDIIHVFTTLMDAGADYSVLEDMVCTHPAVAEALPVLVRKLDS
ncbi:MAG: mercuric reductase [bacterium]